MQLLVDRYRSPVGELVLVSCRGGFLRALDFVDYRARMERLLHNHYGSFTLAQAAAPAVLCAALARYFAGDLTALDRLQVRTAGTPFQERVWSALRAIPAGTTTSYGALATRLGRPGSARAVGTANGANPVAIVVPCHRVIGAQGALTGYAGGLERKRWLLEHEAARRAVHAARQQGAAGGRQMPAQLAADCD